MIFCANVIRLELHSESGNKPELIFMDQIEDIAGDLVLCKGEQCIQIRVNDNSTRDGRILLTNSVCNTNIISAY